VDLNLLVTLEVLLTELNVTKAAERLNLSQPSVSVQLGKLRHIYNDPLLLPGPRGMLPTSRALELLQPLRAALLELEHVIEPQKPFDPSTAEVTWSLAAQDYTEFAILLPMLSKLRLVAPLTRIAIRDAAPSQMAKQLELGVSDLGFLTTDTVLPELRCQSLFREHYVLIGRKDHPRLKQRPTIDQFCSLEHIVVSPVGGGFRGITDTMLHNMGKTRRVVLSVSHFLFVPALVTHSDLVAMLPSRLIRDRSDELCSFEAPLQIPGFEMVMVWHERSHLDPGHKWLREQVIAAL
jgi:DNA-binding transcriptional LysR family regulator